MAGIQNFRTAINGFHRRDVVDYIAYMNNRHSAELEQLRNQLQQEKKCSDEAQLEKQLAEAQEKIAQLEKQLAEQDKNGSCTQQELEAYRRAEQAERQAKERAKHIYDRANAVLAEASLKTEDIYRQIGDISDRISGQLQEYQTSVQATKDAFAQAAAALYAIRPEETDE